MSIITAIPVTILTCWLIGWICTLLIDRRLRKLNKREFEILTSVDWKLKRIELEQVQAEIAKIKGRRMILWKY